MAVMLTQSQMVLTRQAELVYLSDDGNTTLVLPQWLVQDMNIPHEITVTIQPGDHINGQEDG